MHSCDIDNLVTHIHTTNIIVHIKLGDCYLCLLYKCNYRITGYFVFNHTDYKELTTIKKQASAIIIVWVITFTTITEN